MSRKVCVFCEEEVYEGEYIFELPDKKVIHLDCARDLDGEDMLLMLGYEKRIGQEETDVYCH